MSLFTKLGNDIASPVDANGALRSVNNGDMQRWMTEAERWLMALGAGGDVDLPNLLIRFTITGGTADAIEATPDLPVPDAPGEALFSIQIVQENTGNVTINGKPLRTNSGNEIVPGGLTAGSISAFLDLGDHYRLLSDQASASIVAASELARNFAARWASDPEDGTPINDGTNPPGQSAYHHARKALNYAGALSADRIQFPTVAGLIGDDNDLIGYAGSGAEIEVGAGAYLWAAGFRYQVADSGASDHHVTTTGGVNLYVLPGPDGAVNAAALGLDATGTTNETTKVQKLIGFAKKLIFPAGTFYVGLNVTAAMAIEGAGPQRTILTTEAVTNGTTITVGADLNLADLTIKGHPTNANSKTIAHTGEHTVRAFNVQFTGTNHSPAAGLLATGHYTHCTFHTTAAPAGLGALCWSPTGIFTDCDFTGARTIEARDSKFYRCRIGDLTTGNAIHVPDGAKLNNGSDSGYTGICEFYDCQIVAGGTGITQGNAGKTKLRRCSVHAAQSPGDGGAALYARSSSTFDIEDCSIKASGNGTALSFAKTIAQDPNGIGLTGISVLKRTRIEGAFNALAVPTLTDTYPAAIGNVRLVDCTIIGGNSKISPNDSTYHVFETEQVLNYGTAVIFENNDETKRLRFYQNSMRVGVYGIDAAKTGCRLSHLDAVTGLPLPDGMEITLFYSGVSSRFVTFASGATADGGTMYFADGASTLATTQFGSYRFRLIGTSWRQVDG